AGMGSSPGAGSPSKPVSHREAIAPVPYFSRIPVFTNERTQVRDAKLRIQLHGKFPEKFISHHHVGAIVPRFTVQVVSELTIHPVSPKDNVSLVFAEHNITNNYPAFGFPGSAGPI